MLEISQANVDFFAEVMPIVIGTKRRNGVVKMDPVWYKYRDGHFWLNTFRGARWLEHLERDQQASLLLIDPKDMTRTVHIEARLVGTTTEGAQEHLSELDERYQMGAHEHLEDQVRVKVQLEPLNVRSTLDWLAENAGKWNTSADQ
ncbi:hypothetical protein F4560_001972 [Saccharothrix ecbatanensis]|jgi:hypothetical protein|uniref:Pyridoxamine 5'-phosphate oxidase N-terminal domain-containing protein n=1 Tax=Saccharothrix ecbatanensis TaxID=1105145 RepID=A0A7W9HH74_9PSEU|nr:pyridoxamine 5'-phosphate oxidase family protein [Saccharothrix ecbatanensis]MBB5802204.1 hypothetical protein [Saccharothrix ecbatanensis]